jgi:hypothetical protein
MTDNVLPLLFAALAILVQFAFLVGVYWAYRERENVAVVFLLTLVGSAVWMMGTFVVAAKGKLSFTTKPPTMMILIALTFALAFALGLSSFGKRLAVGLPLAALVGIQAFRFPLEMLMHRAYEQGLMPVQMSYSGRNFDIVTGISAAVLSVALLRVRVPMWLLKAWNLLGIVLLANIVTIAMLSAPTPFRRFHNEPANVWITHASYVWLPGVFVFFAILGHIVITRWLHGSKQGIGEWRVAGGQ